MRALPTVVAFTIGLPVLAGTEFRTTFEGREVEGAEVCFIQAAPTGAKPQDHTFFSGDLHCVPSDVSVALPAGRVRYFARANGYMTLDTVTLDGQPDHVDAELVRTGELDLSTLRTTPRQSIWIIAEPSAAGRGAVYPVDPNKSRVPVPADIVVLPVIVEDKVPVGLAEPVTMAAGTVVRAAESRSSTDRGTVITWIESKETPAWRSDSTYAPLKTVLTASDGSRVQPLFAVPANHRAGALQVFRNVPAGPARITVEADGWVETNTAALSSPEKVTVTSEGLRAIPAAVAEIQYVIDHGPVDLRSLVKQSCSSPGKIEPVTISAYRCEHEVPDPEKADLSKCARSDEQVAAATEQSVRFVRLPAGAFVFEATHPLLRPVRRVETLLPAEEKSVELKPHTFPIFGRVTRAGKPARVAMRFREGSSGAGTAVTDVDGRYQLLLSVDPGQQRIEITACDDSFEYNHEPASPLPINSPLDIEIPATSVEVAVIDADSRRPIPNAVVFISTPRGEGEVRYQRRAAADDEGIARFTSIVSDVVQAACGYAPGAGYLQRGCSEKFSLKSSEDRKLELPLKKDGVVRGKLITPTVYDPAMLTLMSASGSRKTELRAVDGTFWLTEHPSPGDYFVLHGPKQPLYVLTSWQMEDDTMILTAPVVRVRSVVIKGSAPDARRLVALRIGGRRVDQSALNLHFMNLRINPFTTWTAGQVLPLIAETAPIAITLGPPMTEYDMEIDQSDVFTRPQFINRLPTLMVPPDRDEVLFP